MENQIEYKPPQVAVLDNGNLKIIKDCELRYNGWLIRGKKGKISDGNSSPWFARWLVPRFGRNTIGGLWHDIVYEDGEVIDIETGQTIKITRRQADVIRLDLCNWCGVLPIQRVVSFIFLRLGGWHTWNKYRKRDASK